VTINGSGRTTTLWDAGGNVTGMQDTDNHLTQYLRDGRQPGDGYGLLRQQAHDDDL